MYRAVNYCCITYMHFVSFEMYYPVLSAIYHICIYFFHMLYPESPGGLLELN